ncbi:hypothetical protein [Pseudanabaena mucicola]|uniref:Uncharacterized protein n=1 Tax=Pseudanabaena mucicola FACHB-723 TaxID=2692860 RepID=A0ABR7ZV06_9CYAN|nr:hypothetical protein [Pseudanabaena mucicola]MBD2187826.1 hypothetical protein [Pseudanabaena mucicola FACHB-723]
MQKLMLSGFFTAIAIAIASTTSVMSAKSETMSEYLDNTTPQVIEKISGNIVTFKNVAGESNNYYVPNWMFERYSLKVGTSANLYNRNITQGIYRGRYIESQGLPANMGAFALHDIRHNCIISEGMATEGLFSGQRVWFKTEDCPSTIPIVGSMSFYKPNSLTTAIKESESQTESLSNQ